MTIRNKLTLLFTSITAALLLTFSLVIYVAYADNREEEYFKRLRQQATTKADLLFDAKVSPTVLQLIYKNSPNALFQEEVAIYDTAFRLLYHDAVEIDKVKETATMVQDIVRRREIQFYLGDSQAVGFLYQHAGKHYVITAAALDDYGLTKLSNLRYTLILALLGAVVMIYFVGQFLAKQALTPVAGLVADVGEITATNLDLRVNEGNGKDEIAELAIKFNQMLDRLEQSFDAQKQFVSTISHELRTPLAAMVAELDLASDKDRSVSEYRQVVHRTLADARKVVRLSNGLLDLAKANYDQSNIRFKDVRLDEILLDARRVVLRTNVAYSVNLIVEQEGEDDTVISTRGNEYLLTVAFTNLLENGCKFSTDQHCSVAISYCQDQAILRFIDAGIGIHPHDIPYVFNAFYRGSNGAYADGNGIGLSLTRRIIELHKGRIQVLSRVGEGTVFTIELPHL